MSVRDTEYYRSRAEAEALRARDAGSDVEAALHSKLSALYFELVETAPHELDEGCGEGPAEI